MTVSFFIITFLISALSVFFLVKLAPKIKLIAVPGEHRQHAIATPMVGGLAIFLGLVASWCLLGEPDNGLLICLGLMCIVGTLDDRYALPSWLRFVVQGIAAYLMIRLTGVQLDSLGVLFSSQELILGSWSTPLTIFATIGVINAVNMSDGLDGLAGGLVFTIIASLLFISHVEFVLIVASLCAIAGFLLWNLRLTRPQALAFMGDAGSTMLGLLMSYLLIKYSQMPSGIQPVTALWLLALPLIDTVTLLIVRPLFGRSPFSADRLHYHHQLLDHGFKVNQVLIIVLILQLMFIIIGYWLWRKDVNENAQLIMFLTVFAVYLLRLFVRGDRKYKS